jgi:hypothetical protein
MATIAAAQTRLSARVGSVGSGATGSAFATNLSRCAFATGSAVAAAPRLEQ